MELKWCYLKDKKVIFCSLEEHDKHPLVSPQVSYFIPRLWQSSVELGITINDRDGEYPRRIKNVSLETIFSGMCRKDCPKVFHTYVFDGQFEHLGRNYETYLEAEKGHKNIIEEIRSLAKELVSEREKGAK